MEHIHETAESIRKKLLDQLQSDEHRWDSRSTYRCDRCRDSGFVKTDLGVRPCECRIREIIEKRLDMLPPEFRHVTLENLVPMSKSQQLALEAVRADPLGSYVLWGDYGANKSPLLAAQYRQCVESRRRGWYKPLGLLLDEAKREEVEMDYVSGVLAAARSNEPAHFFIDEIDKVKPSEFREEALFRFFNNVSERRHSLSVASNLSLRELAFTERLRPEVIKRIDQRCQKIEMKKYDLKAV